MHVQATLLWEGENRKVRRNTSIIFPDGRRDQPVEATLPMTRGSRIARRQTAVEIQRQLSVTALHLQLNQWRKTLCSCRTFGGFPGHIIYNVITRQPKCSLSFRFTSRKKFFPFSILHSKASDPASTMPETCCRLQDCNRKRAPRASWCDERQPPLRTVWYPVCQLSGSART
jgi:hypothetical protein